VTSEEEKNKALSRRFLEALANGDLNTLKELTSEKDRLWPCRLCTKSPRSPRSV
jgi:hypothetical protein